MSAFSFHSPALVLLTDTRRVRAELRSVLAELSSSSLSWVQARTEGMEQEEYRRWFLSCREVLDPSIPMLVHFHWPLVHVLNAPGVHLKEYQSVAEVRRVLGRDCWIGQSVHSVESARRAEAEGVNYLQLGALFPTGCKPGHPGFGLDLLREVVHNVSVPILGVGGMTDSNAEEVLQAGASGISVISAILQSTSPALATQHLWGVLHSSPEE